MPTLASRQDERKSLALQETCTIKGASYYKDPIALGTITAVELPR